MADDRNSLSGQLLKAGIAAAAIIGVISGVMGIVVFFVEIPAWMKTPYSFAWAFMCLVAGVVVLLYFLGISKTFLVGLVTVSTICILVGFALAVLILYVITPSIGWYGPVVRPTVIPEYLSPITHMINGEATLDDLVANSDTYQTIIKARDLNGYNDARYVLYYSSEITKLPRSISVQKLGNAKIGVCILDTGASATEVIPIAVDTYIDLADVKPIVGVGRLVVIVIPLSQNEANKLRDINHNTDSDVNSLLEVPLSKYIEVNW